MPTDDARTITLGIKFVADKNEAKKSADALSKMLESELQSGVSGIDSNLKKLQASAVEANKKVEDLLKTTEELSDKKLNLSDSIYDMEARIKLRQQELQQLQKEAYSTVDSIKLSEIQAKSKVINSEIADATSQVNTWKEELSKVNTQYDTSITKLESAINNERVRVSTILEYKDKLAETVALEEKRNNLNKDDGGVSTVIENFQVMQNLRAGIGDSVNEILTLSSATNEAKNSFMQLGKTILSALGSATIKLVDRLKNSVMGLSKQAGHSEFNFKKLLNVLLRYGLGIRGVFMLFRKLRSAVSEGLKNLQEFNGGANSTANAMNSLKDSMLYLKNSWGAAFAPIIDLVVPYLTALIDKIAEFANVLGAIFALFTGKKVMIKATKQIGAAASATQSGADAQKEWNNELYSFDELNRQSDQSDSSGGGGGGGAGFSEVSPESVLPQWLLDWVNKFKELWSKEKFQEVGLLIAEGLNKIITTVHDWIENTLRPWAVTWSVNIANILNGIVAGLAWEELGATIASGLNTWYDIIDTFFQTFNWNLLGQRFGAGLKSLIDNIEWDLVGRAFSDKWRALIEFIYGVVNTPGIWQSIGNAISSFVINWFFNIPWNQAGEALATGFNGALESLRIAIQNIPWLTMTQTFIGGINTFINDVDWEAVGQTVSDLFTTALGMLVVAISEFDWAALGKAIADFINGINWDEIAVLALTGLMALAGGLLELLIGLIEGFVTDKIEEVMEQLGMDCGDGFLNAIKFVFKEIKTWIKENMIDPLVNGVKDLLGIHSPSKVFFDIGANVVDGLLGGLKDNWESITTFLSDKFSDMIKNTKQSFNTLVSNTKTAFETIKTNTKTTWDNIKNSLSTTAGGIKTSLSTQWDTVKTKLANTTDSLKTSLSTKWGEIKTSADTVWGNLKTSVSDSYANLKTALTNVSFKEIGTNLVNGIKDGVGGAWDSLVSSVSNLCSSLVSRVRSMFQIHSPSKVFADIGENLALGLAEGITDESGTPIKAAEDMAESVSDVDTAIELLPTALDTVLDKLAQIADRFMFINDTLLSVSNMQIPRIATGSIVPSSAMNNSSNSELASNIADAIVSALSEQSTSGTAQNSQDIKIYIRGKEVFNAVVDENNSAIMRTGTSPLMR